MVTQLCPWDWGYGMSLKSPFSPLIPSRSGRHWLATLSNPTLPFGAALEAPEGVEEELVGSALQEQAQAMLEGVMATPRRGQALPGLRSRCIRGSL